MTTEFKNKKLWMFMLQFTIMISSLSSVCSKIAGRQKLLSFAFVFWFAAVIFFLGVHAIIWQQILKRMPLTVAYANRSITLIWGMIWGSWIFHEKITYNMIIGAVIIGAGIYLVVSDNE